MCVSSYYSGRLYVEPTYVILVFGQTNLFILPESLFTLLTIPLYSIWL